jgi:hypothetical protein
MTVERKCTVEPSDIIAIHFECSKCRAATVIRISGQGEIALYARSLAGGSCQLCHTQWGFPNGNEHSKLSNFAEAIETISGVLAGRNLSLRLEIKNPEGT